MKWRDKRDFENEPLPRGAHGGYLPCKIANVVDETFNQKVIVVRYILCRSFAMLEYGFGVEFDFKLMFLVLDDVSAWPKRLCHSQGPRRVCHVPEDQTQLLAARPG